MPEGEPDKTPASKIQGSREGKSFSPPLPREMKKAGAGEECQSSQIEAERGESVSHDLREYSKLETMSDIAKETLLAIQDPPTINRVGLHEMRQSFGDNLFHLADADESVELPVTPGSIASGRPNAFDNLLENCLVDVEETSSSHEGTEEAIGIIEVQEKIVTDLVVDHAQPDPHAPDSSNGIVPVNSVGVPKAQVDEKKKGLEEIQAEFNEIRWLPGVWRNKRNYDYVVMESGEVYFKPFEPWAEIRLVKTNKLGKINTSEGTENWQEEIELINLRENRRYHGILRGNGTRIVWDDGDGWHLLSLEIPSEYKRRERRRQSAFVTSSSSWKNNTRRSFGNLFRTPPRETRVARASSEEDFVYNSKIQASMRPRGLLKGSMVSIKSLTSHVAYGTVLGMDPDGRYRIRVQEEGKTRVFSTPYETLRPAISPGRHGKQVDETITAETRISQVENKYYTHAFVRALNRTTGIPITHSGVLVETKIKGEPIAQTVVDLIEFQGKPYVALRSYMKSYKVDNWDDENQIAKFFREGDYNSGKKPWSQTKLHGKPVSYRVWGEDTTSYIKGRHNHEKWINKIESCIRESSQGEFKLMSRNCQHAAAYTINKLKKEAGVADDRHAEPPNWVFRIFAPASTWVPSQGTNPTEIPSKQEENKICEDTMERRRINFEKNPKQTPTTTNSTDEDNSGGLMTPPPPSGIPPSPPGT